MIQEKKLSNGVRVIVKRMEGLLSVTMGVLVGTGAAFERNEEDGISHLVEHMQFKGTAARTACEISDAFDALGASANAFTGKDLTCYYVKSTTDHAAEAFALLADLFLNSTFPEEELEREKEVVVEEIKMNEDTPDDLCLDLLSRAAFGKANYGRNILGTAQRVRSFTREDIFAYRQDRYTPDNVVLSFAGNIGAEEAVGLAEKYFGRMEGGHARPRPKRVSFRTDNLWKRKPISQAHVAIGFPSVARGDKNYSAVQVMNTVLGGGLSSRLFKRVREELGLAYSVYSYTSHYEETGLLTVYAGVDPQKADAAVNAVKEVLESLRREGISEEEFARGKEQLRASLVFSQENTSSQMLLYGKSLLYEDEVYDFEARMSEIAALKRGEIEALIGESFDLSRAAVAAVGKLPHGIVL